MKSKKANGETGQEPELFSALLLDDALRHADDVFDRANINFFLAGETAIQVMDGKKLDLLPEISLGLRMTDWGEIQQRLFLTTMEYLEEDWKKTKDGFEFAKGAVPIRVKVMKKHNKFFNNLDNVFYDFTQFLVPNQFKTYRKMRNLMR